MRGLPDPRIRRFEVTYQLEPEDQPHAERSVHQAVGMVSVQARVRARRGVRIVDGTGGQSTGVPVHTIALAVVTDVLRFDDEPS